MAQPAVEHSGERDPREGEVAEQRGRLAEGLAGGPAPDAQVIQWDPKRAQAQAALDNLFRPLDDHMAEEDDRLWGRLSGEE